jgi:hypothetical protein
LAIPDPFSKAIARIQGRHSRIKVVAGLPGELPPTNISGMLPAAMLPYQQVGMIVDVSSVDPLKGDPRNANQEK